MERVEFKLGEKKRVCIRITSTTGEAFEVSNAKYILLAGKEAEDSGVCEINQKSDNEVILTAIVQPQRNNTIYRLEYTYEIPPEILKCDILISVY